MDNSEATWKKKLQNATNTKTQSWRLKSAILEPTYIIVTTEQYIHDSYFKLDIVQKMSRLMTRSKSTKGQLISECLFDF